MQGRLLYGELQSDAVALITEDFYQNLRRLGTVPGLGFYLPEEDPKNPDGDKANLRVPHVVRFVGSGPGSPTRRLGPTAVPGQPGDEETIANPDPVTGEDMSSDWNFSLGFKIKLGEPPESAAEKKEGD